MNNKDLYLTKLPNCISFKCESNEYNIFSPKYSHQIFGPIENIFGYQELNIVIRMTPSGSYYTIKISHKKEFKLQTDLYSQITEIKEKLTKHLHEESYCVRTRPFEAHLSKEKENEEFQPPGNIVRRFSCENGKRNFIITMGTFKDERLVQYFKRIQHLNLWFIDGYRLLDTTDPNWRIFFLFEKCAHTFRKEPTYYYTIGGFSCVYLFSLSRDSKRLRISTFFILPAYAATDNTEYHLLSAINRYARGEVRIDMVTCEDPDSHLQLYRSSFDFVRFLRASKNGFDPQKAKQIMKQLQMCLRQFRICVECWYLIQKNNKDFQKSQKLIRSRLENEIDDYFLETDEEKRIEKEMKFLHQVIEFANLLNDNQEFWVN
ncbi:histone acetyltransferase type b catalytic subunit [Anaeramoeba flamelloides]|uniref:histone acetyltransferase n=1 Tax=Anaeramoeba flamelloides TaxID=1746091 RepID=A0AAV7ZR87_9EUKA|nr:histone acetyltransferase type b catalytic subunit [Anaeramoeba flamelloides]KAJ6233043.1 histone acetyltransferase type b catalytic subunit [Anaeramoeba flamelloides]